MAPGPAEDKEWAGLAPARSSSARSLHQAPDLSVGSGEPPVGLPQDPRGAPEARHRRLGHDHRHGASPKGARPGATADRAQLDAVPAAPGPRRALFAPHSEEEDPLDLEPDRQRHTPAPVKEDPTADTPHAPIGGTPGSKGKPPSPPSPRGSSARVRDYRPGGLRDSRSRRATHGRLSVEAIRGVAHPPSCWACTPRLEGRPRARAVFVETNTPESELTFPACPPRSSFFTPQVVSG